MWQPELYTPGWLADSLDLSAANDKEIVADYGSGLNCPLFDKTGRWAYRAIRQGWPEYKLWLQACGERASACNLQFAAPLDKSKVSGMAKNIAKWTHIKLTKESFNDHVMRRYSPGIPSARGSRSKPKSVVNSEQTVQS